MAILVLSVTAVILQLGHSSCRHQNPDSLKDSWLFPYSSKNSDTRFERQMPPHHEPDAVLINTGGDRPSRRPGDSFPGGPGVFGTPSNPGYPGAGFPGGPGIFGIPGYPGGPDVYGIPGGPSVFGIPGGQPQMPGGPRVFGMPGGPPQIPGPNVFSIPGGPPQIPVPGVFGMSGALPQMPGPGVFVIPDAPPQMPGGPSRIPRRFHMSGSPPEIPRGPGVFGVPGRYGPIQPPNTFELPQNPTPSRGPGFFGISGQLGPESSTGPGVFVRRDDQGSPMIPNGPNAFEIPNQGGSVVFRVPGEPIYGRPNVFPRGGGDNIPFRGMPGIFITRRIPNIPETADDFPITKDMKPEKFIPDGLNGFHPMEFPGVYFPDSTFFPASPESTGSSEGRSPRKNIFGSSAEREVYDDPIADIFPNIDKSTIMSGVSN